MTITTMLRSCREGVFGLLLLHTLTMQVYTMLILLCTSNITYILCYHCLNSFKYPVTQFLLYLVFFIPGSAIHTITGIVSGLYSADSIVLQGLCRKYCIMKKTVLYHGTRQYGTSVQYYTRQYCTMVTDSIVCIMVPESRQYCTMVPDSMVQVSSIAPYLVLFPTPVNPL